MNRTLQYGDEDWVNLNGSAETLNEIRAAGVPQDPMMSNRTTLRTKGYVKRAVDMYISNGGYGGMSLEEFLRKMIGTRKEQQERAKSGITGTRGA